jgi:hypothetical protein
MQIENLTTLKIHKLTKKQYERELKAGRIDTNAIYLTPDEPEYADAPLQQWYDDGIMYTENGNSLNVDGLNVSCAPNSDTLKFNYTGYVRLKDTMYDAGNSLSVDGVSYPGVYEGEVKSSISLYGTVGVWTFEYFQIDRLDTFVSADYVNKKVTESANEINTTLNGEVENLNTKIDAVNDKVDDILYEDISLQELLDNGQLRGTDWSGQTVTPSVSDLTVSGINSLIINYTGYIEFKVKYGATQNAVSIDGVTIETPMIDTTEFKGYVNSHISIYCTVMSATFEYIRTKKEEINLVNGEGEGSIIQKNFGVTNSSGKVVSESTASGKSAVALGAASLAAGNASLAAGYGAEAYQQGSAAFGSSVAGDVDNQHIITEMLKIAAETRINDINNDPSLTDEEYLYIENNFNNCKIIYNERYPEKVLVDNFTITEFKRIKYSFAFAAGDGNTASGRNSVALGGGNTTTKPAAVGIGAQNEVLTENSVAVGALNKVSTNNGIVALGYGNNVSGGYSIGVGKNNTVTGNGSGALGLNNEISSSSTFALGDRNKIAGDFGAIIGSFNEIKKGTGNFISGVYNTVENGSHASVLGSFNKANATYQTVIGKYNKPDASKIFIVGGGTGTDEAARKNIFTVDYSGNIITPGSITSSTTTDLYQKIDDYIYTFENYRKIENFASTINGVTLSCKNMKLVATSTKTDTNITHIYDKKRLNGSIYKFIKIKFKTTAVDPTSCMYFDTNSVGYNSAATIDGQTYRAIQYFTLTNNGDGTYTGIANLSDNKIWTTSDTTGGIKSIRFDIPNSSAIGDITEIEYIGIFATQEEANSYDAFKNLVTEAYVDEKINEQVNTKINNITYSDVSLQELYDNNKLYIDDHNRNLTINGNTIMTEVSQPNLYIDYTGYVKFKVQYGGMSVDTVKIDGNYVPMLDDETTIYEGYVNNQIEIYGTVSTWKFEYFEKKNEMVSKDYVDQKISALLARIEALEAQVSEANAILETI